MLTAGSTRRAEVKRSLVRCTGVLLSWCRYPPKLGTHPGWVPNRFVYNQTKGAQAADNSAPQQFSCSTTVVQVAYSTPRASQNSHHSR